jgi:AcrR family transcriptional regulator
MVAKRNKPYHHGNLAAALVDVAAALVAEEGAAALTVRAVAQRAGVTATALYRHYADKEALLTAVATRGLAALVERFEQARTGLEARPALTALGMAYIGFAHDHPHLHALMFGPRVPGADANPELVRLSEQSFRMLVEATAACLGPTAPLQKTMSTAIALWSLVHGYATLRRDGQLGSVPPELLPDPFEIISSLVPQP